MYIPKISTALQTESVDGDENEMSLRMTRTEISKNENADADENEAACEQRQVGIKINEN